MAAGPRAILQEMEDDTWAIFTDETNTVNEEAKEKFCHKYITAMDYAPGMDCLDFDSWDVLQRLLRKMLAENDPARVGWLKGILRLTAKIFRHHAPDGTVEEVNANMAAR